MDVGTAIVADCQAAHSVQPGERPFDYPAVAPELGRQLDATPSDSRLDPTNSTHRSTDAVIVGLVGVQLLRPSPGASSGLANGLDRVERSAQMKRVVVVGGRQQGSAAAPTARRLAESRLARDQSICPFCPSSCCRALRTRSQTPACCQSRRRRQQVIPEPHPISRGRSSQGIPVLRTNTIPVRTLDCHLRNTFLRGAMATTNNRLPVRAPPEGNMTPAAPRPAGSALLSLAQALIDKSKKAGGTVAQTGGRAARAAGRAARAAGRVAPEKVADIAIEEGASLGSHLLTHTTHRYAGGLAVGVKGGLELLALIMAKMKRASPRVLRGLRSTLRGTLHHSLGMQRRTIQYRLSVPYLPTWRPPRG